MNVYNVMLGDIDRRIFPFGYVGENLYTGLRINCVGIFSEYPDAAVTMVVRPPQGDAYPRVVDVSGVMVSWVLTSSDLAYDGVGTAQLTFTKGEVVIKSVKFDYSIDSSLAGSGEAPDPVSDWVNDANGVLAEVEQALQTIEGKADEPTGTKAAGKVYGLDNNLDPVWVDQQGGGTSDYDDLTNKPQINSVTLSGNKSLSDLGIHNVPAGGETGKILKKVSDTDYDLEWGDAPTATDAQVETAVDAWLGENITNPSNPPLDRSLSLSNAAAPADLVGDLHSAVTNIEDLTSGRELTYFTFIQGSVNQQTGELDTTTTTNCRTDKIPAKKGDTFTYSRTVNKITTTFRYVIYNTSGNYVSGSTGGNVTITMPDDGYFVLMAWLNSTVQATMEEAIAAAHDSLTGMITAETTLVQTINGIDGRLTDLEESGVAEVAEEVSKMVISEGVLLTQSMLLTGKYYTVSNGIVSAVTESSAKYCDLIDVSHLRGKRLMVHMNTIRSGSNRYFGFCDASMNVGNCLKETSLYQVADGSRYAVIIADKDYLFFSCSSDPSTISIEIATDYLFVDKNTYGFETDTKKYYHFSFDDVTLCLQDITTNASTYESIFENDFLAWCKLMHDKYGTTFSMYVFFTNGAATPWTLEDCTNAFAEEFTANADWLKWGFHAYAPGSTATSRESSASTDYTNTITQLVRITGSIKCIDRIPRLHEYNGTLAALKAFRDCEMGCVGFIASADTNLTTPRDSYYFDEEENDYIFKHCYMFDAENHLHFVKTSYLWGASNVSTADKENAIAYANLNKYVEIFTHENQLTDGYKSSFEQKICILSYSHKPYYMMDLVLTT